MAKIRNRHIYGTPEEIKRIKEESDYIGRNVSRIAKDGHLIIYALPPKKKKRPKTEEKKESANKRRPRRGNGYNRYKEMYNHDD